ncbi:MAG: LamG-like jellyroll fold domain-containing protein [Spirochaetota bacterium]
MKYVFLVFILTLSHCSLKTPDIFGTIAAFASLLSSETTTVPLEVSSTSPADGDTSVGVNSSITVNFNQELSTSNLTVQDTNGSCTDAVQISSDEFASCVGATLSYSGGTSLQIIPASNWQDSTTYKLRISTIITNLTGEALESEYLMPTGFTTGTSTVPTIANVSVNLSDGTYNTGQTIEVSVTFSESVVVSGSPYLILETGSTDTTASYASGSGSSTLVFSYTVVSSDVASDLDYVSTSSLELNGGSIQSQSAITADLTLPVPGASGSIAANHNIAINTNLFQISVTVSGLASTGLSLQNNSSDTLSVTADGVHTFATSVATGDSYSISVSSQPSGQKCTLGSGASGTVASANISLTLTCGYQVSVTVSNLTGTGLVLTNNLNTSDYVTPTTDGTYTFNQEVSNGASYSVEVYAQPNQTGACSVSNAGGTIANANVTNIVVDCAATYANLVQSTSGLVSYWRLGAAGANDSFGSNNGSYNGSNLVAGLSGAIAGDSDTSVWFANDSYVEVPYSADLAPTGAVSVEFWLYALTGGNCTSVLHFVSKAYNGGYGLYCDASGVNFGVQITGSTTVHVAVDTSTIRVGWHHIVGTFDGQYVRIYLDGVLQGTSGGTATALEYTANNSLIINGQPGSGSTPQSGTFANLKLDEVAVYNKALDAQEVKEHYRFGTRQVREYLFISGGADSSGYNSSSPNISFVSSPTNTSILDAHGVLGGAYSLSGAAHLTATYGTSGTSFPLGSTARSLCTFFYPTSYTAGTTYGLLEYGSGSDNQYFSIYLNAISTSYARVSAGRGSLNAAMSVSVPLNSWAHVCSTYDGSNLKSYVNGVLLANTAVTLDTQNSTMYIGAMSGGGSSFQGRIDDVRIYNTALTDVQIKEIATQARTMQILNYDFQDTSSSTVRDISGLGNNGTSTLNTTGGADRFSIADSGRAFSNANNTLTSTTYGLPQGNEPRTICAWVVIAGSILSGAERHLFTYGSYSSGQLQALYFGNDGAGNNTITYDGQGSTVTANIPNTDSINNYNFVCAAYDGSNAYIYWNGNQLIGSAQSWSTNGVSLRIGADLSSTNALLGGVSDFRIYRRYLTANEIKALAGNN